MAKRRRLVPSAFGAGETVSDRADPAGGALPPGFVGAPLAGATPAGSGLAGSGLATSGLAAPPIARVAAETAAEAALAELSQAMARARAEGRLVQALPLAAVDPDHLLRDRIAAADAAADAELGHLMASIRDHGQRSPIEVTELAPGRYGLISGWRRLTALQRLQAETGEARFGTVLALLRRPDTAAAAYVAMIEENEVRQGLSYYERARVAARAADLGVFDSERAALQRLFAAASRARRSKIGSFITLYRALDAGLRFPSAIPERLGLALAQRLAAGPEVGPEVGAGLLADLQARPAATPAEEQARLARFVAGRAGMGAGSGAGSGARAETGSGAGRELRPGLFLATRGSGAGRVLQLSGPAVDAGFRARLERWLQEAAQDREPGAPGPL